MSVVITGNETVKEVLMMHIKSRMHNDEKAQKMFDQYVTSNKDYIECVLERKCKEKWAYCQMSFIYLNKMILDSLVSA